MTRTIKLAVAFTSLVAAGIGPAIAEEVQQWKIENTTDQMNDQVKTVARNWIEDGNFKAEIQITCVASSEAGHMRIAFFDQDDRPEKLAIKLQTVEKYPQPIGVELHENIPIARYEVRFGSEAMISQSASDVILHGGYLADSVISYTNVIDEIDLSHQENEKKVNWLDFEVIRYHFYLAGGEMTVAIHPHDPNLEEALRPCLSPTVESLKPVISPSGKSFLYVPAPNITWAAANNAAKKLTFHGLHGYLATIETAEIFEFVISRVFGSFKPGVTYLGGKQTSLGEWRWITGPDAAVDNGKGKIFWRGFERGKPANDGFGRWMPSAFQYGTRWDVSNVKYVTIFSYGRPEFSTSLGTGDQLEGVTGYLVEFSDAEGSPVADINTRKADVWVEVTKPMLSCGAVDDSPELRHSLLDAYALWRADKPLPDGCEMLRIGEKLLLDDEQTESDTQIVVKMWRPVCPHGCLPSMTPVYSPSRNAFGAYLRATRPPQGW